MDAPDLDAPGAPTPRRGAVAQYLYGVIRSGVPLPRGLVGVDRVAPVRMLECRGLAALVSEVPADKFDEDNLRRSLTDVVWLEEVERAHELVLEEALAATAVVPLRVCTVYGGEAELAEMLGREYRVLLEALERLAGRAEWCVKVYVAQGAIEREALRRAVRDEGWGEEGPSGAEWAREIHADLALFAEEALINPSQPPELNGRRGEMLLNGVYLVDDEEASAFRSVARQLVERCDRRGIEIDLVGPCPAYNFVKSSIEAAR